MVEIKRDKKKLQNLKRTRLLKKYNIEKKENLDKLIAELNLLKPTGYVMHQQFNIQQLYALPTLFLCVLYSAENKQRLVPLIS